MIYRIDYIDPNSDAFMIYYKNKILKIFPPKNFKFMIFICLIPIFFKTYFVLSSIDKKIRRYT